MKHKYTSLSMALAIRLASYRLLGSRTCLQYGACASSSTAKAAEGMEKYWKKNRQLNRPMSPHLTIYRPQITSMLSISHRITGAILTGAMYLVPFVYLSSSSDYAGFLEMIKGLGSTGTGFVLLTKFSLSFSLSYHFTNAIRHLLWDNAKGFKLPQVYKSGYTVLAVTCLLTAVLMSL